MTATYKKRWVLVALAGLAIIGIAFGAPGCGSGVGSGIAVTINASKG